MKRVILAVAVFAVMVFSSGVLSSAKVEANDNERAVVEFRETVRLMNVFLRGNYLVIHDDSKMAQGEPCLYVYEYDNQDKVVVAFHCKPVVRGKVDQFKIVASRRGWFDVPEVLEIQFAGSEKAHQVP
jgi:hypothetical protein